MKKILLWIFLFSSVLNINIGFSQDVWEYRSHFEIAYTASNTLDFKIKPKTWFREIIHDLYSSDVEIGFNKKLNNWMSLSPYYRHIVQFKEDNQFVTYNPQIDIAFFGKINNISLNNRNRFEYRIKEENNSVRYRNKLTIKSPIYFHDKIRISLAEEPFYDCTENEFNKNRIYFNIIFPMKNNITVELFYILEHFKNEAKWQYVNVLGTSLKYKISWKN